MSKPDNKTNDMNLAPSITSGARINRKVVAGVIAFIGIIVLLSLSKGLTPVDDTTEQEPQRKVAAPDSSVPGTVFSMPSSYSDMMKSKQEAAQAQAEKETNGEMAAGENAPTPGPVSNTEETIKKAEMEANLEALQEEDKANRSGLILLGGGEQGQGGNAVGALQQGLAGSGTVPAELQALLAQGMAPAAAAAALGNAGIGGDTGMAQNMQGQKQDFINSKRSDVVYLDRKIQSPTSPYEVAAGSVIPAAMVTGINTDLPGDIVAQVRENVYDTANGNHLLIPQGTRLVGRYDSLIAYGQNRALLMWDFMIFPDGSSMDLDSMQGTDTQGYAGLSDKVDHHYLRLASGVLLSSILSIGITSSEEDTSDYRPTVAQRMTQNAGSEVARQGNNIAQKNLNVQPTINIRPGYSFNVFVHKTLVLKPYQY